MSKFCLITKIAVSLIFCINGLQVQTTKTELSAFYLGDY